MNLLVLSELFYPNGGGAELASYLYAKLLSEVGFDVVVVTNSFAEQSQISTEGNIKIYRLPLFDKKGSPKYSMLKRIDVLFSGLMRRLLKWTDLVYIPRFWFSAILSAKAYGKPVIVHLHDYIPICPLGNFYDMHRQNIHCDRHKAFCSPECIYAYERNMWGSFTRSLKSVTLNTMLGQNLGKLVALSDAVVCVSKAHREFIAERAWFLSSKMHVIYNPFPDLSLTRIEDNDFGYFGGPNRMKGVHVLRNALIHTKDKGIKVHATNFSKSIRDFPLVGRRFLPYKRLDTNAFEKIWKQIHGVIVPSIWHEPLPYVVSEAMLRGRFVIASNVGGIPEQVEGCKGALLCEAGNSEQIADAMDLVSDLTRESVTELGRKNREAFLAKFDNKVAVRRFIDLCESLG